MKSSKAFAAIAVAFLVTVSLTAATLQQAPPGGPPPGQAPERGGQAGAQQQTATGQLVKVDAAAKEITIKSGDKEMVFTWIDSTEITGAEGAQGLTGKPGATLKITYQSRAGANLASKIEVQEDKK